MAQGLSENIETNKIDDLISETCAYMNIIHPSYSLLAARVSISNLHKSTNDSFLETIKLLYNYVENDIKSPLISEDVFQIVINNSVNLFIYFHK